MTCTESGEPQFIKSDEPLNLATIKIRLPEYLPVRSVNQLNYSVTSVYQTSGIIEQSMARPQPMKIDTTLFYRTYK